MDLNAHPTIRRLTGKASEGAHQEPAETVLDAAWLRQLASDCGADDAGLVEIARPGLDPQGEEILRNYPWTKSLLASCSAWRGAVRGRSGRWPTSNSTGQATRSTRSARPSWPARGDAGPGGPSMGFPMEMYQTPGHAIWIVSHKPVAVEAGLGHMGIHRNLIHPRFGNFVLLGTVLIDRETTGYDHPIDYNPCLECKLCVAACPVGAIGPEGSFNFSSCFTHNYREFLGGFTDWVEQVADAATPSTIAGISESETASMWQSLSHGANYKSAYCMAVCPAGEDVIGAYLHDRQRHLREVVRPLQERAEPVYVVAGSDAEVAAISSRTKRSSPSAMA